MREVTRSALVGQPPQRLYELIADVERYPEFVPGCVQARIESREGDEVVATLGIRRGVLDTAFTMLVRIAIVSVAFFVFSVDPAWRTVGLAAVGFVGVAAIGAGLGLLVAPFGSQIGRAHV